MVTVHFGAPFPFGTDFSFYFPTSVALYCIEYLHGAGYFKD